MTAQIVYLASFYFATGREVFPANILFTQCTAFKMTAQIDYLASFYSATRSEFFQQNCGRNCSLDLPSGSSISEVISGKFLWFNQKLNLSSK